MTGKVLENNSPSVLILILPLALFVVVLYTAWPVFLGIFALILGWKFWDTYQWQQWCKKINPYFTELIRENQGYLTPMDLSLKANLTGSAAKRFLDRKALEYGAQRRALEGEQNSTAYYFITASSLGTIFDDSDPVAEAELEALPPPTLHPFSPSQTEVKEPSSAFASLVELKESRDQGNDRITELESSPKIPSPSTLSLIQADLAKRLDINTSTLTRRRSDEDFSQWSQSKDPEGIAWKYLAENKIFVPIES